MAKFEVAKPVTTYPKCHACDTEQRAVAVFGTLVKIYDSAQQLGTGGMREAVSAINLCRSCMVTAAERLAREEP